MHWKNYLPCLPERMSVLVWFSPVWPLTPSFSNTVASKKISKEEKLCVRQFLTAKPCVKKGSKNGGTYILKHNLNRVVIIALNRNHSSSMRVEYQIRFFDFKKDTLKCSILYLRNGCRTYFNNLGITLVFLLQTRTESNLLLVTKTHQMSWKKTTE